MENQSGSIIIFVLLLLGIMLAIVLTLTSIFAPKITSSAQAKNSAAAIYAADSGLEWCLYLSRVNTTAAKPVMSNGAKLYRNDDATEIAGPVVPADVTYCNTSPVKIIGTYQGVSRALEVSF